MKKNKVEEQDVGLMVRNCRLFYKLGLTPSEEKLDPLPLTVPLGCETPLTRKEMFQMFGYGSYSNPALYDDEDEEEWSEGSNFSEFPISKDEVSEETGLTEAELETSKKQEVEALKNKLLEEHLLSSAGEELPADETTTETQSGEGDSGAE